MRRVSIVVAAAVFVVLSVSVVQARIFPGHSMPMNRQNVGRIMEGSIPHKFFVAIPGWGVSDGPPIQASGAVSVTVSITVQGGPIDLRVFTEAIERNWVVHTLKPSSAHFDPGAGTQSFSFTFVTDVPAGPYTVNLEWRSPTGALVTETGGSVVIQYAQAS